LRRGLIGLEGLHVRRNSNHEVFDI
jgi:hypothetical protein